MPGGDRTGPWGLGPRTGRAAGYCSGYGMPGYMNPIGGRGFWGWGGAFGRGFGGRGGGRGWRNWYYATGLPGWARFGGGVFGGWPLAAAVPSAGWPYGAYAGSGEEASRRELDALKSQAEYLKDTLEAITKRMEELDAKTEKE